MPRKFLPREFETRRGGSPASRQTSGSEVNTAETHTHHITTHPSGRRDGLTSTHLVRVFKGNVEVELSQNEQLTLHHAVPQLPEILVTF